MNNKTNATLFTFLGVILSCVVFFIIFELSLRVVYHNSMDFDLEMWKYARELKREAGTPEIGHEHVPNASSFLMGAQMTINEHGLRDEPLPLVKPDNELRILMLGDSLTVGWGVDVQDTTSNILESELSRTFTDKKVQVINTGVGNYNTSMEVGYFLQRGYKFQPDLVVLNYFINDAEPTPKRKSHSVFDASYAYVLLRGRTDVLSRQVFNRPDWQDYYSNLYETDNPGLRVAEESIGRLAKYCADNNIPLLIANYPELHETRDYPFDNVRDWLKALSAKLGVAYVDLFPAIEGEEPASLWVSENDAHPNRKANDLFVERMIPSVLSALRGVQ